MIQTYLFVCTPPPESQITPEQRVSLDGGGSSFEGAGGAPVSWPLAVCLWETARAPARPLRRLQAGPLLHCGPLGGVAPGTVLPCPVVGPGPEAPLPTFTSPCSSSFASPCSKLPGVGVKTGLALSQPGYLAEWPHFSDPQFGHLGSLWGYNEGGRRWRPPSTPRPAGTAPEWVSLAR